MPGPLDISRFIVWPISEEPQFEIHSVDSLLIAHMLVPYRHNLKLFKHLGKRGHEGR